MKNLLLVFAVAFLIVSCEDELRKDYSNDVTTDVEVLDGQKDLKSGQPEQPGDNMKVYRFEDTYYWVLYDESTGLKAYVGYDVFEICFGIENPFAIVNFQDIVKEDDFVRVNRQIKGSDVHVSVWDFDIKYCSEVAENEPVFLGTGNLVSTDNDVFSFESDRPNSNTWGLRLHGDGITIIYQAMWDGENIESLKENVTIKVK